MTLDATTLENTFDTVGQSMMQLARAQDQTNIQLQQHIQHGEANMQAHIGALQQLATSTYQRTLTIYLLVYPYMPEVIGRASFSGLIGLEVACFYSGRNIKIKALGRSAGPVKNMIIGSPKC